MPQFEANCYIYKPARFLIRSQQSMAYVHLIQELDLNLNQLNQ